MVFAIRGAQSYEQQNRDLVARIVDGDYDGAIKGFEDYLESHPKDLESLYGLAVAYTQKRDFAQAMQYVNGALDAGLPFSRFLAGPRDLLHPLIETGRFAQLITAKDGMDELVHGPTLGCVTDSIAKFWVRTFGEVVVQVSANAREANSATFNSDVVRTDKNRDYTAILTVDGLKPDVVYDYKVRLSDTKELKRWSFRTFPVRGCKAKFQVGFGGGAGYNPQNERMWNTIAARKPLAFLFLGDNVYIDHPTRPAVQQYCYYRRQSRPEFRDFAAGTAIYAIWDDHDFTTNDGWGGPEIHQPEWKIPVWRVFRDNWNNPYYGGAERQPGCWFDFSIGDVDFFMLDCRYYRTNPKVKDPSMLGSAQKKWLFEKLGSSKATFKVLVSSVPWAFGTKPGSLDTWEGYKQEREEVFSFLEQNKIGGVVLLSADRHRSDVWRIERPDGYTLYELESSKLTNVHTHRLMPGALFGYNEKCSFGLLSFDTMLPDPQVTHQIINIDGEVVYTISLKHSQLMYDKNM
jgi:alkaline phosphatase D